MLGLGLSLGLCLIFGSGSAQDAVLLESGDKLLLETGDPVALDTSIPAQASAGALDGTELVAIVQDGVTSRVSVDTLSQYLRQI